jgi:hypothetical protein
MLAALGVTLLMTQAACNDKAEEAEAVNPALATPVPAGMVRGTVVETMDAAGYTYVLLETSEGQSWYAAQQTAVSIGDVVQTDAGMPMQDFTSKTLGRTFDVIYFTGAFQNLSAGAMPEGHPATAMPPGHPPMPTESGGADTAAEPAAVAAVEEGKDIAWVYANKDSLADQPVSLRGQVVKYNANILGTNFVHIQDGSGDAADGSNDLIVTTQAEVAVGQTVVVSGNIVLSKDFGAGYSYPVLMEDASVTVE